MEERYTIKFYNDRGFSESDIFKTLKSHGVGRSKVYRTVKRLRETSSIYDRKRSGRPRSVRTKATIKKVMARFRRNPVQSANKMSQEINISTRSLQRIIKIDLGLKPYKKRIQHGLTDVAKKKRFVRCQHLLDRYAPQDLEKIVFSDEKLFLIEEKANSQNIRIYSASIEDIPEEMRTVERFQKENKTMVWCGISKKGKFPMTFVEKGVKINAKYYQERILEPIVKVEGKRIYKNSNWTFQQDSAPAHKAITTQQWCTSNLPDFISTSQWPPYSPDLNPLDYSIWGILEARVNAKRHRSIESLKTALIKEWDNLPMEMVRNSIDSWIPRLNAVVQKKGGRIE